MPETTAQQKLEDPIKDYLVCCQHIPLRWRKLEQSVSEAQLISMQSDNIKLMEVLVSEDVARDVEQQLDKESLKEIRKLDAKLNLLMGWIGKITLKELNAPDPQSVCLSAKGAQFQNDNTCAITEGDHLWMELYLEPRYPQAFTTLATVVRMESQAKSVEIVVRFTQLSEQNQQWLEKYIFQLHRRQVAYSKKSQDSN